jgi:hypothetical protein
MISIDFAVAGSGTHTLSFAGTDGIGDKSTFLDAVMLMSDTIAHSISGIVTSNGSPLASVHFTAPGGGNCVDSDGGGQAGVTTAAPCRSAGRDR